MSQRSILKEMERIVLSDLQRWQQDLRRKPLIVHGARQVGKTWLLKEFGRSSYANVAYVNFEANPRMDALFAGDLDPARLLAGLRVETGVAIEPGQTLLIFDEIQANPRALTSLKYFAENAPGYHLTAAGSLLGVAMHRHASFPVGKVGFLQLNPLSFEEFLLALDERRFSELIRSREWAMVGVFADKLIELLKYYLYVGGMPESVATFAANRDANEVRVVQQRLLSSYEHDFSRYADAATVPRIRAVWNSLPAQLAREQRKFRYGLVREGARSREYETAIEWLCDAGLVFKVHRISRPALPLRAYREEGAFKLFMADTGLLAAHAGLPLQPLLGADAPFAEFKGALTEQYVAQELRLKRDLEITYWANDAARAEVDFVVQTGDRVVPLEVKAAENLQSKSLRVFHQKFTPQRSYRSSLSAYREDDWLVNVPLYALMNWPEL